MKIKILVIVLAATSLYGQVLGRGGLGVGVGTGTGAAGAKAGAGMSTGIGAGPAAVGLGTREKVAARTDVLRQSPPSVTLADNAALAERSHLLPSGQTPQAASAGFKTTGDFLAAAHASKNLDIPFDQLKARVTGKQKTNLGDAIHEARADVNAKAEAKKATAQAQADVEAEASKKEK